MINLLICTEWFLNSKMLCFSICHFVLSFILWWIHFSDQPRDIYQSIYMFIYCWQYLHMYYKYVSSIYLTIFYPAYNPPCLHYCLSIRAYSNSYLVTASSFQMFLSSYILNFSPMTDQTSLFLPEYIEYANYF